MQYHRNVNEDVIMELVEAMKAAWPRPQLEEVWLVEESDSDEVDSELDDNESLDDTADFDSDFYDTDSEFGDTESLDSEFSSVSDILQVSGKRKRDRGDPEEDTEQEHSCGQTIYAKVPRLDWSRLERSPPRHFTLDNRHSDMTVSPLQHVPHNTPEKVCPRILTSSARPAPCPRPSLCPAERDVQIRMVLQGTALRLDLTVQSC